MTTYVFLGPSLDRATAREHLDAAFLPPVALGDLYSLVEHRCRPGDRIAIVDGVFERVAAVWHKEILYALSRGMHVYGASSMGALRAAELAPFGMQGVGRIFSAFTDGRLDADDEVAVAHADQELDYRSLSHAMVSLRFALADLAQQGAIPDAAAAELTARAKAQHYSERHWSHVLGWAGELQLEPAAASALAQAAREPDAKARDAIALLDELASLPQSSEPFEAGFTFNTTVFWQQLTRSRAGDRALSLPVDERELGRAALARAGHAERDALLNEALFDHLVARDRGAFHPSKDQLRLAARRLAARIGIAGEAELRRWQAEQGVSEAQWRHMILLEAQRHAYRTELIDRLDPHLVLAMKRSGSFSIFDRAIAAGEAFERDALTQPDIAELEAWYRERFEPMYPDPQSHAKSLGFDSLRGFLAAIRQVLSSEDRTLPGQPADRGLERTSDHDGI